MWCANCHNGSEDMKIVVTSTGVRGTAEQRVMIYVGRDACRECGDKNHEFLANRPFPNAIKANDGSGKTRKRKGKLHARFQEKDV